MRGHWRRRHRPGSKQPEWRQAFIEVRHGGFFHCGDSLGCGASCRHLGLVLFGRVLRFASQEGARPGTAYLAQKSVFPARISRDVDFMAQNEQNNEKWIAAFSNPCAAKCAHKPDGPSALRRCVRIAIRRRNALPQRRTRSPKFSPCAQGFCRARRFFRRQFCSIRAIVQNRAGRNRGILEFCRQRKPRRANLPGRGAAPFRIRTPK